MGVSGRPTRAWALSTDSEMPRCSDQPKESSAAHVNVEAAITTVVRLFRFMAFLRHPLAPLERCAFAGARRCDRSRSRTSGRSQVPAAINRDNEGRREQDSADLQRIT